ncbi:hypothetical protein Tco_1357291, partial [Tanacetum coccineum]
MNDLNDMVDVEGGNGSGDSNRGKGGEEKWDENVDRIKRNNEQKENINSGSTYAKMVTKGMHIVNNKLYFIPTEINKDGSEIVIFDEDLVDKGSVQWKLTVCDMKNDRTCMFKFRNEAGMNKVLELEAWSKEGISALASSLGDTMTAKRYSLGEGRMDFARILVEFDVMKGLRRRLKYSIETKENIKKRSRNKFEVLNGMDTDNEELDILKGGMIVDQLEINKLKNMEDGNEDIKDVLEANSGIAKDFSTKELE